MEREFMTKRGRKRLPSNYVGDWLNTKITQLEARKAELETQIAALELTAKMYLEQGEPELTP